MYGRMARRALVTGSNRGIGLAIARGLRERGFEVLAASRTRPEAPEGTWIELDVTDAEQVARLPGEVGTLDVLVNNAGVALDGFDLDVVRETLAVNVRGLIAVTDAVLPNLAEAARVIMMSSGMGELKSLGPTVAARFADPALDRDTLLALLDTFERDVAEGTHEARGWPSSAYRISKAAVNAFTRVLARELAPDPRALSVNAVCPGWVATDMGGPSAPRTPEEGADTAIWLATEAPAPLAGGWFRDRRSIPF